MCTACCNAKRKSWHRQCQPWQMAGSSSSWWTRAPLTDTETRITQSSFASCLKRKQDRRTTTSLINRLKIGRIDKTTSAEDQPSTEADEAFRYYSPSLFAFPLRFVRAYSYLEYSSVSTLFLLMQVSLRQLWIPTWTISNAFPAIIQYKFWYLASMNVKPHHWMRNNLSGFIILWPILEIKSTNE